MNDEKIEDPFSRAREPRDVVEEHAFDGLARGFAAGAFSRPQMVGLLTAVALAIALAPVVATDRAEASFPGANGRIAFTGSLASDSTPENPEGDQEIYTMAPDGTDIQQLTSNTTADTHASWSWDGQQIVFGSARDRTENDNNTEIYVMNADGTNQIRLTNHPADDAQPTLSPDGTQIAFESKRTGTASWKSTS